LASARLLDARLADQRQVAEDLDLRGAYQRAGEEVVEGLVGGLGVLEELRLDLLVPPRLEAVGDLHALPGAGELLLGLREQRHLLLELAGQSMLHGLAEGAVLLLEGRLARGQQQAARREQWQQRVRMCGREAVHSLGSP